MCKMSKGHADLKRAVKCAVLRVGIVVPLKRERSHVILVMHIAMTELSPIIYMACTQNPDILFPVPKFGPFAIGAEWPAPCAFAHICYMDAIRTIPDGHERSGNLKV